MAFQFSYATIVKCSCGYTPTDERDAERHIKTAGKPKFERKPHLTQRPLRQHSGLEALRKELEKNNKPRVVKRVKKGNK